MGAFYAPGTVPSTGRVLTQVTLIPSSHLLLREGAVSTVHVGKWGEVESSVQSYADSKRQSLYLNPGSLPAHADPGTAQDVRGGEGCRMAALCGAFGIIQAGADKGCERRQQRRMVVRGEV